MTQPSDVQRASERFKRALLANERAAASDMLRQYGGIWRRLRPQVDALIAEVEDARKRGEQVQPSTVAKLDRTRQLLAQVEQEVGKYAEYADASIRRQQSAAIEAAGQHAEDLTRAAMGDAPTDEARLALRWNRLPREAVADLVGQLASGAPLDALLGELGPDAAQKVKDALLDGLAMGRNPRVIARDVRRGMGMPLTRSLRIARTETLRAYRRATLANYAANGDTVTGWRWSASHSSRTCLACLAMDGKVFPLDKPAPMHVQCRCSCIPATVSWRDLGVDAPDVEPGPTGAEWFAAQPASVQREMMGDEAYKAWKAGRVTLDDFVGVSTSRTWGESVGEVRLKDALAQAGKARDFGEMKATPTPTVNKMTAEEARKRLEAASRVDYDAEIEAIRERRRALMDRRYELDDDDPEAARLKKESDDLLQRVLDLQDRQQGKLTDLLYVENPVNFKVDMRATPDKALLAEWERGIETFKRLVSNEALEGKTVGIKWTFPDKVNGRASYDLNGNVVASQRVDAATMAHELSHWLEDVDAEIHRRALAFYDRRTAGEALAPLTGNGYEAWEMTRPDKFHSPYVGKEYRSATTGQRYATEIVSMGVERMIRDPLGFARDDADYFDFIYDLLRGR